MAEDNISDVKEAENSFNTYPPAMSEENSVDVGNAEDVISVVSKNQEECSPKIAQVPKSQVGKLRRQSTGVMVTKPQVKSRYRGDHHVSSIHEFCKHGNKCDKVEAVKPWKVPRRKSFETSESVKVETSGLKRSSFGSVSKLSSMDTKRDALGVKKKKPSASLNSESSKEDKEMARSVVKTRKNREAQGILIGSALPEKVPPGLRNDKVSRISDGGSCKNLKNKEKAIRCEDVKEKTVCVVESSIKSVQREEEHPSSETKTMRVGQISTGLIKKKETGSAEIEANPKLEKKKKMSPKKAGLKVNLAKQLSFKRGKVIEPKSEGSSPKWMKFRKSVVREKKTPMEERKKKLKEKPLTSEAKSDDSKHEKVVLRHRNVEGKKKMMTLFNNVIEETMSKLTKARSHKVKALVGAFETVISLQNNNKTTHKGKSKPTTSASQVSPLLPQQ